MKIPLRPFGFVILGLLIQAAPGFAAPVIDDSLRHMSSVQRVRNFERFLTERPALLPQSTSQVRLVRAWLDEQRELYKAHDAEHILELFDLFVRRQGLFKQTEALGWLTGRLADEMNKARLSRVAADPRVLRIYADAALVFSAGPISSRLSRPLPESARLEKWSDQRDAVAYHLWRNRPLKIFIANLAERVPGSPVGDVARTRWFFGIYDGGAGCGLDLTAPRPLDLND